ncbi:MAG: pseudouridine synthase [Treponemataceae bacterium]|nr:pseudouridine synthase [Treponemataceae bacterium]HOJ98866.1 pseudouridine synthase [Termitinemataceae bacterium]HOM22577.1 pseudouridine synthase [Termitinemataceae bacterium]HPQ00067.1 pseudouridine synthase [Termitinemataceae bacterium]
MVRDKTMNPWIHEGEPRIVYEEESFLVVYKPPRIHTVPLDREEQNTLLAWCARRYPEVLEVKGKKPIEGGVLHRLDYETQGLVLVARTQAFYEALQQQQEKGMFVKEYEALCAPLRENSPPGAGYPPAPPESTKKIEDWTFPFVVQSAFRAYGPGRKEVRPLLTQKAQPFSSLRPPTVLEGGAPYETEILSVTSESSGRFLFSVRIRRGFRHQIRVHLRWLGYPILGDVLYGGASWEESILALRSWRISFLHPQRGEPCCIGWPSQENL